MNLQSSEEREVSAVHTEAQSAHKSLFADPFFLKLVQQELPLASFCQKEGLNVPKSEQFTSFLVDLARRLAHTPGEKAKHEFMHLHSAKVTKLRQRAPVLTSSPV